MCIRPAQSTGHWFEMIAFETSMLFRPSMSLSPSNHQAQHFFSSPWPRFQLLTPQSTSVLAGLTSVLTLVVCLSPAAPDSKLSSGASCLCQSRSLSLFPQLMLHSVSSAAKRTALSPSLCLCCWKCHLPFSQISFVLAFFCWYYLAHSHSCNRSLFDIFLQRGDISSLFPPSPILLGLFGVFFFFPFDSLSCHYRQQ